MTIDRDVIVMRRRRSRESEARAKAESIEKHCLALATANALPRRAWRDMAHQLFARHVYVEHIRPFESVLTMAEMAERLERIGIPRFRRGSPWSAQAVSEVRKVVADLSEAKIWLPDD